MLRGARLVEEVSRNWAKALYYAFGRLDERGVSVIVDLATKFADAYAERSRQFHSEETHHLPAMQNFWDDFAIAEGLKEMGN